MIRVAFLLALLIWSVAAWQPSACFWREPSVAALQGVEADQEQGDLYGLVEALVKSIPGWGSYRYRDPNSEEAGLFVDSLVRARTFSAVAASAVAELGFKVVNYTDEFTGRRYVMFREQQPCRRCWGTFILSTSPTRNNVTVEVPHPLFDQATPLLGIEAFLTLDADEFLMAGAHRYANGVGSESDMARNQGSIFQRAHEALADSATQVAQYHGFSRAINVGYPDMVLSNGSPEPHPILFALKGEMEVRGLSAGIYDGDNYRALSARINPQGRYTRSIEGSFLHLEHVLEVRLDPSRRAASVEALAAALNLPVAATLLASPDAGMIPSKIR